MASRMQNRSDQERYFCREESKASMKCMSDSGYDKSACNSYFDAYKACMKEWNALKSERRRKGLLPTPPIEDLPALKLQSKLKKESQNELTNDLPEDE
eukprot:gene20219-22195_t